jgi:anti-sigma regulatory factor (Ser/Thr protein kinase)
MTDHSNVIKLEIKSHPRFLTLVRILGYEVALMAEFSQEEARDFKLALDEACTNVIKHSYHYDYTKPIIISFYLYSDRLETLIQDFGEKVDPSKIRSRPINDVKPSGLGVYIMRKLMDVVEYDHTPSQGPRLKLVKYKK